MLLRVRQNRIIRPRESYKYEYLGTFVVPGDSVSSHQVPILAGRPDPTRELFLVCFNQGSSGRTLTGASFLGADGVIQTGPSAAGSSGVFCVRMPSPHPALGGLLNLTWNNTVTGSVVVAVFRTAGRKDYGADASDTSSGTGINNQSITNNATTVQVRGFWIGCCSHGNANPHSATVADIVSDTLDSVSFCVATMPLANLSSTPSVQFSWSGFQTCRHASWSFDYAT